MKTATKYWELFVAVTTEAIRFTDYEEKEMEYFRANQSKPLERLDPIRTRRCVDTISNMYRKYIENKPMAFTKKEVK